MAEREESKKPKKDKYKLVQKLGGGEYGQAYLVQSKITYNFWVIKKVDLNPMSVEERLKAKDEAKILQVLSHPNIIMFKDSYKDTKMYLNLVMEYADDGDLAGKIKEKQQNNQSFTENEILNYFTQICLGVKHCHDRKILHRDIKPQNVMLTRKGLCKLGDFGVSKVLSGTLQKFKSIIGTPAYLSPEILNSKEYNQKTDIWSLGILLYEMAALDLPWKANTLHDFGHQICNNRFPPLPNHYSYALKNIVSQCLFKNPSQRPNINMLLNLPTIKKRIKNYLQDDVFREEFSHTILHNQNVFHEFKNRGQNQEYQAAAQQEQMQMQAQQENSNNGANMFHPPASFITEGGQEDQYRQEMNRIVNGIELNDNENYDEQAAQEELIQPDGIEMEQFQNSSQEQFTQLNDEHYQRVCDWDQFYAYMSVTFGEEEFNEGYQKIKEHHEQQAFNQEGTQNLRYELSEMFSHAAIANDFFNLCIHQILAQEQMQNPDYATNLNEENRQMLQQSAEEQEVEDY